MYVVDCSNQAKIEVEILPMEVGEYRQVTIKRYFFNWKEEQDYNVYKLRIVGQREILGLMSLDFINAESRVEIRLLAASVENRGAEKKYDRIAGNLIGFAAREAIKRFQQLPCISLKPKTELREHYMESYYMKDTGISLFTDGIGLIRLSEEYG